MAETNRRLFIRDIEEEAVSEEPKAVEEKVELKPTSASEETVPSPQAVKMPPEEKLTSEPEVQAEPPVIWTESSTSKKLKEEAVWNAKGWTLPAEGWCTAPECGQKVEQKLFTIDHLVFFDRTSKISQQVQLGGMFGTPLFGVQLKVVEFADGKHHAEDFLPVKLNRAVIQKQLAIEIYQMRMLQSEQVRGLNQDVDLLDLLEEMTQADENLRKESYDSELTDATLKRIRKFSEKLYEQAANLTKLPIIHINLGQGSSERQRAVAGITFLRRLLRVQTVDTVLNLAWRVRTVNGQKVPYELVRLDAGNKVTSIGTCRCAICAAKQHYLLGVYPQRVTGMLGTQKAGKTSLLAAFVDVAAECTAKTGLSIRRLSGSDIFNEQDEQWDAFGAGAGGHTKPGSLWCYQRGYSVEKTAREEKDAPPVVLSFIVSDEKHEERNFISTFTDIPGEVLYSRDGVLDRNYLAKTQPIILQCSSYFVALSVTQSERLGEQKHGIRDADMISEMQEIGTNLEHFFESADENSRGHTPVALLFTKFDKLMGEKNEDEVELPILLGMANDIKSYKPIAVQGDGQYFFNAEPAAHISSAMKRFGESYFHPIVGKIVAALERQKSGDGDRTADKKVCFAAFPMAAYGCERAPFIATVQEKNVKEEEAGAGTDAVGTESVEIDAEEETGAVYSRRTGKTEEEKENYMLIKQRRFGIATPFLWLYTTMDMLKPGSDVWGYRGRLTEEQIEQLRVLQAEELFGR